MNRYQLNSRGQQKGLVLIVSLLVLLLLAIIATTVSETNLLQLRMAGNEQAKTEALQRSLALVDAILDNASNTPVVGGIGYKICKQGVSGGGCNTSTITVDGTLEPAAIGDFDYFVTRVGPLETTIPVMSEQMASSGTAYKAAKFEITSDYDGSDENLGRARVVQGILVRIAAPSQ